MEGETHWLIRDCIHREIDENSIVWSKSTLNSPPNKFGRILGILCCLKDLQEYRKWKGEHWFSRFSPGDGGVPLKKVLSQIRHKRSHNFTLRLQKMFLTWVPLSLLIRCQRLLHVDPISNKFSRDVEPVERLEKKILERWLFPATSLSFFHSAKSGSVGKPPYRAERMNTTTLTLFYYVPLL